MVEKELRRIVRIAGADLDGTKKIERALQKIKGVSHMFSHAIRVVCGFSDNTKLGDLEEKDFKKIEEVIKEPAKFGVPKWLLNRRRIYETKDSLHLVSADLDINNRFDLKRLIDIKTYRGLRNAWGLPVRGQRTKSGYTKFPNRRKRRGNVIGVTKQKLKPGEAAAKKGEQK